MSGCDVKSPAIAFAILFALASGARAIDSTWNYAVEIDAAVQASPAQITLGWKQDTNGPPASYTIYRKALTAADWGSPIATLPGTTTSFTDSTIVVGSVYEYQVLKDFTAERGYRGYGYVEAAINAPLQDSRGTVVLIVDNTCSVSLAVELQRLERDLTGDGWVVIRHDVGRSDSAASVKNLIRADYDADPANVNTVFLFGHVPVPYSGLLNPDGHPGHLGAWPADVYYGDMDGQWTDNTVDAAPTDNSDPADVARLTNRPGDGKFDQSTIPGPVRLMVGRADLSNLPGYLQYQSDASFPSEQELLRRYLEKDHNFRHGLLNVRRRALIGDYIGDKEGVAVAASGFRSFAPIVGESNVTNLNILHDNSPGFWLPTLKTDDYLLALGCGAGSYTTVSGIGVRAPYSDATSTDLVGGDIRAVFVMLFGSWCGDWDTQDNIVRSVLATPTYGLVSLYTGVPHWYLHPLGLGETIGYCARLTQNNTAPGLYRTQVNSSPHMVHIALMGDPTLRLNPVAPPSALTGASDAGQVHLNWTASPDPQVLGYQIYRAGTTHGPFVRLTTSPIATTSFTDPAAPAGATYLVRAEKLETTPSGSYFNASQGIFFTASGTGPVFITQPTAQTVVAGQSATLSVAVSGDSAPTYQWQLNGGNLSDATNATLSWTSLQPENAGVYTVLATAGVTTTVSNPAILGLTTTAKVIGAGAEVSSDIRHPNGNIFDQVLLSGAAASITAESTLNQVTRLSYLDLNDDIVQVEFSGAGTLSILLDALSGPAAPANYNQPSVNYVKGHAGIVIAGADETTNVSIFTVGRATAFDPTGAFDILQPASPTNNPANNGSPLFQGHETTHYDGIADLAFIAISSANGKFGGVRTAGASYFSAKGLTGIYAPGVQFQGPVFIGDINASDAATPVILIGSCADTRITGGDLLQGNGRPVQVTGLSQLKFTAGATSQGTTLPAQTNQAILQQDGMDVTNQVVVNPAP